MKNRCFLSVEGGREGTGGQRRRVKVVMEALGGAGRTAVLHMHIKEEWPERGRSNAEGGTR